jgi:hypothetical protein
MKDMDDKEGSDCEIREDNSLHLNSQVVQSLQRKF